MEPQWRRRSREGRRRAAVSPANRRGRWYAEQDSNLRPLPPQGSALSSELPAHRYDVGAEGEI